MKLLFLLPFLCACSAQPKVNEDQIARDYLATVRPGCEIIESKIDTVYSPKSILLSLSYTAISDCNRFYDELNECDTDRQCKTVIAKYDSIYNGHKSLLYKLEAKTRVQLKDNNEPIYDHAQRSQITYRYNNNIQKAVIFTAVGGKSAYTARDIEQSLKDCAKSCKTLGDAIWNEKCFIK